MSPFSVMTQRRYRGRSNRRLFACCLDRGKNHSFGLPEAFVSYILITYYLGHTSVWPPTFHHSHLPVVSHLLKFLSFSTLVSPATFLPDHVSGPLVIPQSTRGSKRILTTKRSEWPKALLLSHGYCDLTFVCIFADIGLLKKMRFFSSIIFEASGM